MAVLTYRARWLFPVLAPPLADAWIEVQDGTVTRIGSGKVEGPTFDLGPVAILPVLVNAHAHLEFSGLTQPLGSQGMRFPEWIREVVKSRRELGPDRMAHEKPLAIEAGLHESSRCGVGLIGEIAAPPWIASWYSHPMTQVVAFHELLGLSPERSAQAFAVWHETTNAAKGSNKQLDLGVSPHAPYTISLASIRQAAQWSRQNKSPLAMHLAESPEETELIQEQRGSFRELLESLGAWCDEAWKQVTGASSYLSALSESHRAQVVHGNYLETSDWELLASRRDQLSLVHCPRTHAYFNHSKHPVKDALKHNVRLVLGTDSRASNPDLNLWKEAQQLFASVPEIDPAVVLRSVTSEAAYSLGKEATHGALVPGRAWKACLVPLTADAPAQPQLELLLGDRELSTMAIASPHQPLRFA